jgi:hypothetical protein
MSASAPTPHPYGTETIHGDRQRPACAGAHTGAVGVCGPHVPRRFRMPLQKQGYGDWEFEVRDPNGYILVFSELRDRT